MSYFSFRLQIKQIDMEHCIAINFPNSYSFEVTTIFLNLIKDFPHFYESKQHITTRASQSWHKMAQKITEKEQQKCRDVCAAMEVE